MPEAGTSIRIKKTSGRPICKCILVDDTRTHETVWASLIEFLIQCDYSRKGDERDTFIIGEQQEQSTSTPSDICQGRRSI